MVVGVQLVSTFQSLVGFRFHVALSPKAVADAKSRNRPASVPSPARIRCHAAAEADLLSKVLADDILL